MRLLGGVDRALGVGADDLDPRVLLFQVAADSRDGAAGADRDHDCIELAAGLLPDLRPSRGVVRLRVRLVRVLVGLEATGDLLGQPVRDRVVALRGVVLDRGGRDHDFGAVGPQHRDLLLAHLVGHHEDAAIAARRRRDREPDARVTGGWLDDRAAGAKLSLALGRVDHREADPILVRTTGVEVFELREEPGLDVAADPVEANDRGRTDELEQRGVRARHRQPSLSLRFIARTAARASTARGTTVS